MQIDGDIKVWTDGDKACARLTADGPEGPIVVHASAPLGPVRRQVERAFARRGVSVSGGDPAYKSAVRRLGRTRALKRLRQMAPAAFQPGGLASHLARKKLSARKRLRQVLARAGRPIGAKPIGVLRSKLPRGLAAVLPAGAASAPGPRQELRPAPGGGAAVPGGATRPDELPVDPPEEAEDMTEEPPDDEGAADVDLPEEAQDGGDGGQDEREEVGMDPRESRLRRLRRRKRLRLRAAMRLLAAAQREPRARQRVRHIVSLAGVGNPKAKKALKALAVAKKVGTAAASAKTRALARVPPAPVARRPVIPPRPPAPRQLAIGPARPASMRWWDIFAPWRGGIG